MPATPVNLRVLRAELTLNDHDVAIIFGDCGDAARKVADSITEMLAQVLFANKVSNEDIAKLQLSVCNDEKAKLYLLLMAPLTGLMTNEHFYEIQTGQLSVVNFDDLIIAVRYRMTQMVLFYTAVLGGN